MQLQRSHVSIVRSIRQISLARDWIRARGAGALPDIGSFQVNERAGDGLDLSLFEATTETAPPAYVCQKAGDRVRAIHGTAMVGRPLRECLLPSMADAVLPIWDGCVASRLPVYSIIPLSDADGRPVTLEQVLLPYSRDDTAPHFIITSLHAWSTEGRFVTEGLLRIQPSAPQPWSVVLDPDARKVVQDPRVTPPSGEDLDG